MRIDAAFSFATSLKGPCGDTPPMAFDPVAVDNQLHLQPYLRLALVAEAARRQQIRACIGAAGETPLFGHALRRAQRAGPLRQRCGSGAFERGLDFPLRWLM